MKQIHVSRAGRKAQIMRSVYLAQVTGLPPYATPYFVAKDIGMKPSTHVKKIINELVSDAWLTENVQADLWGRKTYHLRVTSDAWELISDLYARDGECLTGLTRGFEQ